MSVLKTDVLDAELQLVPFGTMSAHLRRPIVLTGTPAGHRLVYELESGCIESDRLRATMVGSSSADWLTVGPEGTGTMDVRVMAQTDDGALIFIQYNGRVDLTDGIQAGMTKPLYSTPRFETGDPRYLWLNHIQAVGKGRMNGPVLTYQLFELR